MWNAGIYTSELIFRGIVFAWGSLGNVEDSLQSDFTFCAAESHRYFVDRTCLPSWVWETCHHTHVLAAVVLYLQADLCPNTSHKPLSREKVFLSLSLAGGESYHRPSLTKGMPISTPADHYNPNFKPLSCVWLDSSSHHCKPHASDHAFHPCF